MQADLRAWQARIATVLAGFVTGSAAKLADESPLANQLGLNDLATYLGLWVVILMLIAGRSMNAPARRATRRRVHACDGDGVRVGHAVAVWSRSDGRLAGWTLAAVMVVPPLAALIWPARWQGWPAALGAALPIGLLVWEAYSLRFVAAIHATQLGFDLLAATLLTVLLPANGRQRLRVLAHVPLVYLFADVGFTQIVPQLLGMLR